jgi:hypothetical protein
MQIRQIKFLTLKIFEDRISNNYFVKIITQDTCEVIKINQKSNHSVLINQLQPHHILDAEVIKTRKNWILNEIHEVKKLFNPKKYKDYETISWMQRFLNQVVFEEMEIDILKKIITYFDHRSENLDFNDFKRYILAESGFINNNTSQHREFEEIQANHLLID